MAYTVSMLYIGADHRGFGLKESLKRYLTQNDIKFEDFGASQLEPGDDYVDYGLAVARAVAIDPTIHKGILICGGGIGMDIVANKVKGIRSALVGSVHQAVSARTDDDTNILVLEADETTPDDAGDIADRWLNTEFSGAERHVRRLEKISQLEEQTFIS